MFSKAKLTQTFLLLTILSMTKCCESYIDFGYTDCSFIVGYTPGDCYNFHFDKCEWPECTFWYNGECWEITTFFDTNYNRCTNRCCDPSVTYDLNWGGINQCQDYLNRDFKIKLIVGLTLSFFFLLVAFFIYMICFKGYSFC